MAGLLYYLPGAARSVMLPQIEAMGLGHVFDRFTPHSSVGVSRGPDSNNGAVLAVAATVPSEIVGYYPDRQTWKKAPGKSWWVGVDGNNPPKPEDLGRDEILPGHLVRLADQENWIVPIIRGLSDEGGKLAWSREVPTVSRLNDDGVWIEGEMLPEFEHLWQVALDWFELANLRATDEINERFGNMGNGHDYAAEALDVNYRIGPAEASILRLFTPQIVAKILNAIADMPTYFEWIKKKLVAGSGDESSSGGQGVSVEDTDPRCVTSGLSPSDSTPSASIEV